MRKLKLQMQVSIDGYIAGSQGEMDWMTCPWTEDINDYVSTFSQSMDTILLGRKLAEGFIPHWAAVAADPSHEEHAAGVLFSETPRIVFSRSLEKAPWANVTLIKEALGKKVNELKAAAGKDIIAYGGAELVAELIKEDLIDEYHLFVNPVSLGKGLSIFQEKKEFRLLKSQVFDCGIVLMVYGR
jgi:dihydrofolate reductase